MSPAPFGNLIQNIHNMDSDNLARARLARKLNPRSYELQQENKLYLLKKAAQRESKRRFFKSRSPLMKQYRQIMKNRQIKQRIKRGIAPKKNTPAQSPQPNRKATLPKKNTPAQSPPPNRKATLPKKLETRPRRHSNPVGFYQTPNNLPSSIFAKNQKGGTPKKYIYAKTPSAKPVPLYKITPGMFLNATSVQPYPPPMTPTVSSIKPRTNKLTIRIDPSKNIRGVQKVQRSLERVISADPRMAAVSEKINTVASQMSPEQIQNSNEKVEQTINEFSKQLLQSKNPMALLRAASLFAIEKYKKLIGQTPKIQQHRRNELNAEEKTLMNNLNSINAKLETRVNNYKMYVYITLHLIVSIFLLVASWRSATNFGLGLELPT